MSLCCPCCDRPTIAGLTRTEEAIVKKLSHAEAPLTAAEIGAGLPVNIGSISILISRLRAKLIPHGWTVSSNDGFHVGVYELVKLPEATS